MKAGAGGAPPARRFTPSPSSQREMPYACEVPRNVMQQTYLLKVHRGSTKKVRRGEWLLAAEVKSQCAVKFTS